MVKRAHFSREWGSLAWKSCWLALARAFEKLLVPSKYGEQHLEGQRKKEVIKFHGRRSTVGLLFRRCHEIIDSVHRARQELWRRRVALCVRWRRWGGREYCTSSQRLAVHLKCKLFRRRRRRTSLNLRQCSSLRSSSSDAQSDPRPQQLRLTK